MTSFALIPISSTIDAMPTKRINVWSGPRNVSTALMYSFAQRSDTRVVDEPLYGYYLRVSGAPDPGAEEVMAHMYTDAAQVIDEVILGPCDRPVLFMKQMAHHLVELDRSFLAQTINVLLIRDPVQMLPSLAKNLEEPTLRDTGLALQTELYDHLRLPGQTRRSLMPNKSCSTRAMSSSEFCARLGLPFEESMLSWQAGPRPEDGIWAKHWYHAVHQSTGWQPYTEKSEPMPARLQPLLAECLPHYQQLNPDYPRRHSGLSMNLPQHWSHTPCHRNCPMNQFAIVGNPLIMTGAPPGS